MRTKLQVVGLLVCAAVLTACTFQFSTVVNADGTGEFRTEIGVNADEQEQLSLLSEGELDSFCSMDLLLEDMPADVDFREEQRGDETWCVATQSFTNLDELRGHYGDTDIQVNRLEITEDQFYYDVDIYLGAQELGADDLEMMEAFGIDFKVSWELTAPGSVISHNADEVDGRTLRWNLSPGGNVNMAAESNLGGGGIPVLVWVVIGGILIAGGLLVIEFSRSRRAKSEEL
jgi:hypothetical protein